MFIVAFPFPGDVQSRFTMSGFTIRVQLYYWLKWNRKRWDFRLLLNEINVFDCLISWGRAFQREGVASLNDLLP